MKRQFLFFRLIISVLLDIDGTRDLISSFDGKLVSRIFFYFLCLKCFVNYTFRPLVTLAKPHRLAALG